MRRSKSPEKLLTVNDVLLLCYIFLAMTASLSTDKHLYPLTVSVSTMISKSGKFLGKAARFNKCHPSSKVPLFLKRHRFASSPKSDGIR